MAGNICFSVGALYCGKTLFLLALLILNTDKVFIKENNED